MVSNSYSKKQAIKYAFRGNRSYYTLKDKWGVCYLLTRKGYDNYNLRQGQKILLTDKTQDEIINYMLDNNITVAS